MRVYRNIRRNQCLCKFYKGGYNHGRPWGGGARVGVRSPPPPPKNEENFVPVIWGNFCFILHVGAFLLRFSHYSFALTVGGGVIVGNCPP